MSNKRYFRFGLRSKLLLLSVLLLSLPWLGYQYIQEMETYLQRGQEQLVEGTARALALTLSEKPALFNSGPVRGSVPRNVLYVHPLGFAPDVTDGTLNDWGTFRQNERVYREGTRTPYDGNQFTTFRGRGSEGDPLQVNLLVGERAGMFYLYVRVLDSYVVPASPTMVALEGTDAMVLALVNSDKVYERYRFTPASGGEAIAWRAGDDPRNPLTYSPEQRIVGRYTRNPTGYEYEFRLPVEMAQQQLVIAIEDVDDPRTGSLEAIVATGDLAAQNMATLQRPTSALQNLLDAQNIRNYRVRVYDLSQQLLQESGDIATANGLVLATNQDPEGAVAWARNNLLHPLYDGILQWINSRSDELRLGTSADESPQLIAALTGAAQAGYRWDIDAELRTLEAGWPVLADGRVIGAVMVDQNLDGLRSAQNQALASLFDAMLAIMLLTIAALVTFAGNLSSRIRALSSQAERSIDERGRLTTVLVPSRANDEIGDLSRSVANMVERLSHYNQYLENLTARLSHELRTPVTVVRSSLENLRMVTHQDEEALLYIQRAEEGISRLNLILTNMSEATRLEQILQGSEREPTELNRVIAACVDQYRQIYPAARFETTISHEPVMIMGNAEYIVQLMDKVVANAVEFSRPGCPIRVSCSEDNGEAVFSVSNIGPYLDPGMKDRLFDSMVSVRPEGKKNLPHLGLGLHIARMITDFHDGYIYAENLLGEEGVIVVVRVPLLY